jgi:hypothetical protein
MKCKWLVENFIMDNNYEELIAEIKKQNYEVCVIGYDSSRGGVPTNYYERVFNLNDCVVFQGSIQLAKKLKIEKPKWVPGIIADFNKYNCNVYYPYIKDHLLNVDYSFYRVNWLKENKWEFYRLFGREGVIWIRPNNGDKPFVAKTVKLEEFDTFCKKWILECCNISDYVVVSSPKSINAEWRFICNPEEILGMSCYRYQENRVFVPSAPLKAIEKCKEILKCYTPDAFFAIDICEDIEGHYYLMEFNAFSTCGLYKCDKETIVREVSTYAETLYGMKSAMLPGWY